VDGAEVVVTTDSFREKSRRRTKGPFPVKDAGEVRQEKAGQPTATKAKLPQAEIRKPSIQEKLMEAREEPSSRTSKHWKAQKAALKEKFPDGWQPRKKLSPDALAGIRALHTQFPDQFPSNVLAEKFKVSPEAIRRILKSKWTPNEEQELERQERWFRRGKQVWSRWAQLGIKPPTKWRREGIVRDPIWNQKKGERQQKGPRRAVTADAHDGLFDRSEG